MPTNLEKIIEAQNIQNKQLPRTLIGHEVVMAMMMPDSEMLMKRRHIIVLRNTSKPDHIAYSTHYVAYEDGKWRLAYGHYDKTRDDAIRDMIKREAYER